MTTMNDFSIMAAQLARDTTPKALPVHMSLQADTKTDAIRQLLQGGPRTSADIAACLGLPCSGRVGALLRSDIAKGRIEYVGGCYRLVDGWDDDEYQRVVEAKALLRRHGFTIAGRAA